MMSGSSVQAMILTRPPECSQVSIFNRKVGKLPVPVVGTRHSQGREPWRTCQQLWNTEAGSATVATAPTSFDLKLTTGFSLDPFPGQRLAQADMSAAAYFE